MPASVRILFLSPAVRSQRLLFHRHQLLQPSLGFAQVHLGHRRRTHQYLVGKKRIIRTLRRLRLRHRHSLRSHQTLCRPASGEASLGAYPHCLLPYSIRQYSLGQKPSMHGKQADSADTGYRTKHDRLSPIPAQQYLGQYLFLPEPGFCFHFLGSGTETRP